MTSEINSAKHGATPSDMSLERFSLSDLSDNVRNDFLIVIPARYGSTRFPGKVLAPLAGRPVLRWCWESALASNLGPVWIATEDARVAKTARAFGATVVMTPKSCKSGTDRVFQAAHKTRFPFIVNFQGDEPFLSPSILTAAAKILKYIPEVDISTAVFPIRDSRRSADPNAVKAVLAADGRALYFSRFAVPYQRGTAVPRRYEHVGLYAFKRKALLKFVRLPPSLLEKAESLEQLRALENGMTIYAAVCAQRPTAIDTPADLARAERYLGDTMTKSSRADQGVPKV